MKKTMNALKVLTVLAAVVVLFGCNPAEKATDSASMLIIESVLGYTADGTAAAFLESDTVAITLRAELLNPDSLTGPSQYNDVLLTGYNVVYLDTTGAPAGIADLTGSLSSILCEIGRSTTVSLPVVLNSAKLAAPLSGLVGSSNTLNTVAQIELIGQDLVNKEVRTVGNLTIIFADYLDGAPAPAASGNQ
jgi:hypothetical protein